MSKDELRPERSTPRGFRTGVRFSSPPPNKRYADTIPKANVRFTVFRNAFGIMVDLVDYDTDTHILAKTGRFIDRRRSYGV